MSSICRLRLVGLRARQIDLVDDRDDLEVVLDREVGVGERLRLDALRRVDEQQRPFARGQRPRDLVGEVDVPGRVDQIQDVGLAVVGLVGEPDRVRLDRDAALALEVHRVEDLRLHLARLERARHLEETVRERGLAVVDMRDDGEVADAGLVHGRLNCSIQSRWASPPTAECRLATADRRIGDLRGEIGRSVAECRLSDDCRMEIDRRVKNRQIDNPIDIPHSTLQSSILTASIGDRRSPIRRSTLANRHSAID